MQKILVTGGAGFIGSYVVRLLLKEGFHVVVYDNLASGSLDVLPKQHSRLDIICEDILHYSALAAAIAQCDAVVHLAALSSVTDSLVDPVTSLQVNTLGFVHVLQGMRETGCAKRLVYASSAAVYGNTPALPCHEAQLLDTSALLSPYAMQKADNERYATLFQTFSAIQPLGLRYFNVYGFGQSAKSPYAGVITKFMDAYRSNSEIQIFGDGQQSRDFIHVTDVAHATLLALRSPYCGVCNIATGVAQTLLDLVSHLAAAGKKNPFVRFAPARPGDIMHSCADTAMATHYLGFRSSVQLKEGIAALFAQTEDPTSQVGGMT